MLSLFSVFINQDKFVETTFESAQAVKAQRHTLVQEATAEIIKSDAHNADTLSQLSRELQHCPLHLGRSNTEGAQFRSLCG